MKHPVKCGGTRAPGHGKAAPDSGPGRRIAVAGSVVGVGSGVIGVGIEQGIESASVLDTPLHDPAILVGRFIAGFRSIL
jgi:F0F1-type ATP synthase membrane subunit c/vacuolar-type H+-ATPase subunit K